MKAIQSTAIRILGLRPGTLAVFALAAFSAGIMLQSLENSRNMAKAAALLAGPPQPVDLSEIKAAAAEHPFAEVQVRAQLDTAMQYELVLTSNGPDKVAFMVPLLSVDGSKSVETPTGPVGEPEVLAILLMDDEGLTLADTAEIDFGPRVETEGPFGPVLMLNGMVGDAGAFEDVIAQAFEAGGRTLPEETAILRSFEGDRAAAYGPGWPYQTSIFGVFAWIGGALAFIALVRSAIRFVPTEAGDAPNPESPRVVLEKPDPSKIDIIGRDTGGSNLPPRAA